MKADLLPCTYLFVGNPMKHTDIDAAVGNLAPVLLFIKKMNVYRVFQRKAIRNQTVWQEFSNRIDDTCYDAGIAFAFNGNKVYRSGQFLSSP